MPAYNFQAQFVPMILEGRKFHTVRKIRKNPTKSGDWLYLYVGMRTKHCEQICSTRVLKIDPILILPFEQRLVAGISVPIDEFAYHDGFDSVADFFKFFERYKNERLEDFEIVWWNPQRMYPPGDYQRFLEVHHG